jgi:hypothetical protein
MLMDNANTCGDCVTRRPPCDVAAIYFHLACIRLLETTEDFHQSGFSRAIFTDQGVNLA